MATDSEPAPRVTPSDDSELWVALALATVVALVLFFLVAFPERRSVELPNFSPHPRMLDVAAVRERAAP